MTTRRRVTSPRLEARLQAQRAAAYRRTVSKIEESRHSAQKFPDVEAPSAGRIRLVCDEPPSEVTLLVVTHPDEDGGVGGWEEIARDRRSPAIEHSTVPRQTASYDCILDRDELGIDDLEGQILKLYAMGRPDDTTGEPGRIKLLGDTPVRNPLWVLDSCKPGARLRDASGRLSQIAVSIGLSEWEDDSLAVTLPLAATRSTTGKTKARFYRTREGDTLRRIALDRLGSQAQWKTLVDNNRKKLTGVDPDALLIVGTVLRLTASTKAGSGGRR